MADVSHGDASKHTRVLFVCLLCFFVFLFAFELKQALILWQLEIFEKRNVSERVLREVPFIPSP